MAGMGKMLKQAQQMKARLLRLQEDMAKMEAEGSAGGGMVRAVVNGKKDLVSVSINPDVVDRDDVPMLEDLILAAIRQAAEKVEEAGREQMSSLTGGLNLPGLGI
ncbi:MAG: YbaB/EbfC family nucleoid-associated protein [PVC group bacterium]